MTVSLLGCGGIEMNEPVTEPVIGSRRRPFALLALSQYKTLEPSPWS